MLETGKLLCALPIDGVKIHPLHVIKGTKMAQQYLNGEFEVLSLQEYAKRVVDLIEILPPNVVIHRLTGEVEEDRLIAPDYCTYRKNMRSFRPFKRKWKVEVAIRAVSLPSTDEQRALGFNRTFS